MSSVFVVCSSHCRNLLVFALRQDQYREMSYMEQSFSYNMVTVSGMNSASLPTKAVFPVCGPNTRSVSCEQEEGSTVSHPESSSLRYWDTTQKYDLELSQDE